MGRIQRRLAAAIVITALIPLLAAIFYARYAVQRTSARFYVPEVGSWLDRSLGLYRELARTQKESMKHQATAIAAHEPLRQAAARGDEQAVLRELRQLFSRFDGLASLTVEDPSGKELGAVDRGRPVDDATEYELQVRRALGDEDEGEGAPQLFAVFTTDKARFEELEQMSQFVDIYGKIAGRRAQDEQSYLLAFAALLGLTIVLGIGVGVLLARGVSTRIARLADATKKVGAGDLGTRVHEAGSDELTELARAFNRMLVEVQTSRARIEYLQRVGAWQDMARRLAHEIKNPLTPIQLAVEEVHQRYQGSEQSYRKLLDATLEVVEAEVGTLRRLVGEFSDFARLPQARLERTDLTDFLREQGDQASLLESDWSSRADDGFDVAIDFDIPARETPVYLDKQMMRRAIINLVQNAVQAIQGSGCASGRVRVRLEVAGDRLLLDIDDDGPGIRPELRDRVFDPYVTSKTEGTGLGLAIAKKVVIEHGGTIVAEKSDLGGARMRISLPAADSAAGEAALRNEPPEPPARLSSNPGPGQA